MVPNIVLQIFGAAGQLRTESSLFWVEILPKLVLCLGVGNLDVGLSAMNCLGDLFYINFMTRAKSCRLFALRTSLTKVLSDVVTFNSRLGDGIASDWPDRFSAVVEESISSPPPSFQRMPPPLRTTVVLILRECVLLAHGSSKIALRSGNVDQGLHAELYLELLKRNHSSLELRMNCLGRLVAIHQAGGNFEEAALCQLKIATLIAQYLSASGQIDSSLLYPKLAATNYRAAREELVSAEDFLDFKEEASFTTHWQVFSLPGLIKSLSSAASLLDRVQQFAQSCLLSSIILDVLLLKNSSHQLEIYSSNLAQSAKKLSILEEADTVVFPRFFWVRFDGPCFGVPSGSQFVYKFRYGNISSQSQSEKDVAVNEAFVKHLQEQYRLLEGRFTVITAATIDAILQSRSGKAQIQAGTIANLSKIVVAAVQPFVPLESYVEMLNSTHCGSADAMPVSSFATDSRPDDGASRRQVVLDVSDAFPWLNFRLKVVEARVLRLSAVTSAQYCLSWSLQQLCGQIFANVSALGPLIRVLRRMFYPNLYQDSPASITEAVLQVQRFSSYSSDERKRISELIVSVLLLSEAVGAWINAAANNDASLTSERSKPTLLQINDAINHLKSTLLRVTYREERGREDCLTPDQSADLAAIRRKDPSLLLPCVRAAIELVKSKEPEKTAAS